MYTIKDAFKSDSRFFFVYFINTVFLIFIFNLLIDDKYIFYPLLISTVFFLAYICITYIKYKSIRKNKDNLKIQDYEVTYNKDFKDNLYLSVIKDLHFDYNRQINKLIETNKLHSFLFSQFIHNMKTSVAIIELASQSTIDSSLEDIVMENNKLKEQLEQSLNILRLEEFSQDYMPNKCDLLEIIKKVINNNKSNFIYHNTFPKISGKSTYVLTDEKWCTYMINQVVLNAIKYSKDSGCIRFDLTSTDKSVVLKVIDDGIGIPSRDLNRVFELFYTGDNGRSNKNSTGIGLAMVKNVANFLLVDVNIYSKVNEGTTVEFVFPC